MDKCSFSLRLKQISTQVEQFGMGREKSLACVWLLQYVFMPQTCGGEKALGF